MGKEPEGGKNAGRMQNGGRRARRDKASPAAVRSGDKTKSAIKNKGIWRRFFHTLAVAGIPVFALALYIGFSVAQTIIAVKVPQVNANFFSGDASVHSVSLFIGIELLITAISQIILYISYYLRAKINSNLRSALWGKILKLKPKYFDKVSASTLISRITVDSESVNGFLVDIILNLCFQVYSLVLTIFEMSAISIRAGLALLAFTPLFVLYSFIMGRISLKISNSLKFKMSDMTDYLSNLVSCLPLIKAFNRQGYEQGRGRKVINDYYSAGRKRIVLDYLKEIFGTIVGICPEIAIILIGIRFLGDGSFDAEAWYTFYLYAGVFISFISTLGSMWQQSKDMQGSLNKVSDILYEEEESLSPYISDSLKSGDIIFDRVSFGYEDADVFRDTSFTIPGNRNTVIIGYSGSGKSTLLKLLERIYEPAEGRILTGGQELKDIGIRDWRKKIAYVSQDTPLLSGTIRENILYGIDREVEENEIMEALELAGAADYIQGLGDGLSYEVGQFGTRLSGGQRQKISIARAILANAEILILDEPTASLDIVSVNDILHTMELLKGKRTIITVTHDAKAVLGADHVIVVGGDHSVLSGSREEMQMASDFMRQLVNA